MLLTSHWLSMLGMFLVTTALITWIFVLPLHARGQQANPYIGIVVFIAVPICLLAGLIAVPVGLYLARRRIGDQIAPPAFDRGRAVRRLALFFAVATLLNVIVGTQLTYRAVEQMESVQFWECLPGPERHVGHLQEQPRAHVLCRLLPLP
jgi:hypothetical protein